ncbi:MAG: hypothetical protein HKN21_16035, partial [Candidatus Eisenbacteria bacterium]|nr:hypothetical protein [Candidatus Eisenbacteria bacterium]
TIQKSIDDIMLTTAVADASEKEEDPAHALLKAMEGMDNDDMVKALKKEMLLAAKNLEYERAASLRDKIEELSANPPKPSSKK